MQVLFKIALCTWYVAGSICSCMWTAMLLLRQYRMAGTMKGKAKDIDGIVNPFCLTSGINILMDMVNCNRKESIDKI